MIAEIVVVIIILWLVYWIDRERKRNGRPGIPVIGMLFDSVQVNFTETIERSTKEAKTSVNNVTSSKPPPPSLSSKKAPSSEKPVEPVEAPSVMTVPTTEPDERTPETTSTASVNSTDDKPKKKKKHKKSKHSKHKKSKDSKGKHKKSKHKKDKKKKDDQVSEEKDTSDLTPDTTQGTSTDDPYLRKRKKQAVAANKSPNSMKEGYAGQNPTDTSAPPGDNTLDDKI